MGTTIPTVRVVSEAGRRGEQIRDEFVETQEAFQDDLTDQFVPDINAMITATNTVSDEVEASELAANNSATASGNSATASGNSATSSATSAGESDASRILAEAAVATLPEGTINDLLIDTDKAWSSQKIVNELAEAPHTIEDETTTFTKRAVLQFLGFSVTDDSGNDTTIVTSKDIPQTGVQDTKDWAGVAYTDALAIGANPTAKIYPDGTIVGSTDNGDYVRFPDRTLIMWGDAIETVTTASANGNIFYVNCSAVTYPIEQTDSTNAPISKSANYGGITWDGRVADVATTGFTPQICGSASTSQGTVGYILIGKW